MKIMYALDTNPKSGGAPLSTILLANEIAQEKDYSVSIVMPQNNVSNNINNNIKKIEIPKFKNSIPFDLTHPMKAIILARELKKIINREKPDIIHVHMPRVARSIGALRLLRLIPTNIKLIYTDREHVANVRKIIKILYILLVARRYNFFISLTETGAMYWRKLVGRDRVKVIPNTAGKLYEVYDKNKHNMVRKKLNISNNHLVVMFAGRMINIKNWPLAKRIIENLDKRFFHFIFAISFQTKEQEKETLEFIEDIKKMKISFSFFSNLEQIKMSELYYAADIFILTSDQESFGRTAVEAMSRKCIVLGRDVGGLPEVINKKENILEHDELQFVNRIMYYKDNHNDLVSDKEWFYKRFLDNYHLEKNKLEHKNIYEKL